MKDYMKTSYPSQTRVLNENIFCTNIGVPNKVLNQFFGNENIKTNKLSKTPSSISEGISNNEHTKINSSNKNDHPIEIMKNYKGVFSYDNSIDQTKESIEIKDKLNKKKSERNIFDELCSIISDDIDIINSQEIDNSNINQDSNLDNNNFNEISIDGISKSISYNENSADIEIKNILNEEVIIHDIINNTSENNSNENLNKVDSIDQVSIDYISDNNVYEAKYDDQYKPNVSDDLIVELDHNPNEKKLISNIKENINKMIANIRLKMGYNPTNI